MSMSVLDKCILFLPFKVLLLLLSLVLSVLEKYSLVFLRVLYVVPLLFPLVNMLFAT